MCGAQGASTVTPLANGPKVRFAREAQETKSDDLIVYAHPKVDAFQKAPATPVPFVFWGVFYALLDLQPLSSMRK